MRELNNTDFPTKNGLIEGWVTSARSDAKMGINLGESAFAHNCLSPNGTFLNNASESSSSSSSSRSNTTTLTKINDHEGDGKIKNKSKRNDNNGSSSSPTGVPVVQAMRGTRMSASVGFRGKTNQIFLFYQLNGTDVRLVTRDENSVGGWGPGIALDVGIF